jgi:hypothetical protein
MGGKAAIGGIRVPVSGKGRTEGDLLTEISKIVEVKY